MLKNTLLAFIPLFVAVDAIGVLPIFISLTQGLDKQSSKKIILQSIVTALSLAIVFIFIGKTIFLLLGITVADFMIAGGIILFCIAIIDILASGKERRVPIKELGAVPIGTPLIVGPAVLTTCLIIVDTYGIIPTLIAVLLNILIAALILSSADKLIKFFGENGTRVLSKVMALLLAAIAVMMIRRGIFQIIA